VWRAGRVDVAYGLYFAGELGLTAYLFRLSTGAWYNYAVQAIVFGSVIAARALARALDRPLATRAVLGISLAAVAVPAFALTDVKEILARRLVEGSLIQKLLERTGARRDTVFFVDRPGFNRVHGRADLVYDPWLYPVFESIKLAEPRSEWLGRALEGGPVRVVVMGSPAVSIDGLTRTLPEMGYALRLRIDPWFVWARQRGQETTVRFERPHRPRPRRRAPRARILRCRTHRDRRMTVSGRKSLDSLKSPLPATDHLMTEGVCPQVITSQQFTPAQARAGMLFMTASIVEGALPSRRLFTNTNAEVRVLSARSTIFRMPTRA
jgi:hypothetical protein